MGGGRAAVPAVSPAVRSSPTPSQSQSQSPSPETLLGGGGGKGKVGAIPGHTSQYIAMSCFYLHSPQTASGFCKNSARSLVALYHKGALPCDCHPTGAIGRHCSPEGGQCLCRPGVIGRQCTRCRVGYYGFPHCKRKCMFGSSKAVCGLGVQGAHLGQGPSNFTVPETHLGIL